MRPHYRLSSRTGIPRRYRIGPTGRPRLDRSPGATTVAVLSCLSSQPRTPAEILEETGLTSLAQVYRVIHRAIREYNIPIVVGYALAVGPRTPAGEDIREWIGRHFDAEAVEDISRCAVGTRPPGP